MPKLFALFALIMIPGILIAEDGPDEFLKKRKSSYMSKIEKADEKLEEAKKEREDAVVDATKGYIKDLEKVKAYWTKKGELQEALKYQNQVDELENMLNGGKTLKTPAKLADIGKEENKTAAKESELETKARIVAPKENKAVTEEFENMHKKLVRYRKKGEDDWGYYYKKLEKEWDRYLKKYPKLTAKEDPAQASKRLLEQLRKLYLETLTSREFLAKENDAVLKNMFDLLKNNEDKKLTPLENQKLVMMWARDLYNSKLIGSQFLEKERIGAITEIEILLKKSEITQKEKEEYIKDLYNSKLIGSQSLHSMLNNIK